MKKTRKMLSLVIALVMALTMMIGTSAVFAAVTDPDTESTYEMTIKGSGGYTFTAYQIFKGKYFKDTDDKEYLSNVDWADGVSSELKKAILDKFGLEDTKTAKDVADELNTTNEQFAKDLAEAIASQALPAAAGSVTIKDGEDSGKISNLKAGYYYVTTTVPNGSAATAKAIVNVVGNVNVVAKVEEQPTFEKKVQDINDSTETDLSALQDSADYDIGDSVPFTLTATLPSNVTTNDKYKVIFRDQMCEGLTFEKNTVSVVVKHNGVEKPVDSSKYNVTDATAISSPETGYVNGTEFTVTIEDVLAEGIEAKENDEIIVRYSAKLNEKAVTGKVGNLNRAKLVYNYVNKYTTNEGETKEINWDVNIVFTYTTKVNKVDSTKQPLAGAEFKLEKKLVNETWKTLDLTVNAEKNQFSFKGLDDGLYRLTETKAPDGYNGIEPIYFEVKAIHTNDTDGAEALKLKNIIVTSKTKDFTANLENGQTFTAKVDHTPTEADIETDVVNNHGSVLPSTGGIGTTIFYVIGTILVLGAGIVLVARRRVSR